MQTHHKILTRQHLTEKLNELSLPRFSVDASEFPLVLVTEESEGVTRMLTYVPFASFEYPEYITKIQAILAWYQHFTDRGSPVNEHALLLRARNQLALLNEHLGHYKAELDAHHTELEFQRRHRRDRLQIDYRRAGATAADAQAQARLDTHDLEMKQVEAQRDRDDVRTLYDTVGQVLNAMAGVARVFDREFEFAGHAGKATY